jgi:hypothetical protein
MAYTIRWTLFLGLIASAIWLGKSVDWSSISTFFVTLSGFLATEIYEHKKLTQRDRLETDRKLFQKLQTLLPSNGSIKYFREASLANKVHEEHLKPLEIFSNEWSGPEHEFLDPNLQAKLKLFHERTNIFLDFIGQYTVSDDRNRQVMSIDNLHGKYKEKVEESNRKANEMVKAHEDLFRSARKILNI